jgi:hypothetical protein
MRHIEAHNTSRGTTVENPYQTPRSRAASSRLRTSRRPYNEIVVPEDIAKDIRNGVIAGCISGGLTLIVTLMTMGSTEIMGLSVWSLIDVALIFGLTFGIYRKSRVAAILMLVYFVISKILQIADTGKASGLLLAIAFVYCYARAVMATFRYHDLKK